MNELWLAYEGGGSRTRLLLADTSGTVLAQETGGSASPLYIDPESYRSSLLDMLRSIGKVVHETRGYVARAGIGGPLNAQVVEGAIHSVYPEAEIERIAEGDIALALFDLGWGVSLIAGTGASCRYLTQDGTTLVSGALGPQFDDVGSGYWIARESIAAVIQAGDGRLPQTALRERLFRHFQIENVWGLIPMCRHAGHMPPPQVATFAPQCAEAAAEGDEVALRILHAAGQKLGGLVAACVSRAAASDAPIPLVMTGGVFSAGEFVAPALKSVTDRLPVSFTYYGPVANPVAGIIRRFHARFVGEKHRVS